MYAKGKFSSTLSPGVILIILLCVCGMAVHFIAEGLAPACGVPGVDLMAQAGYAHGIHEHSEDHFVISPLTRLLVEHIAVCLAYPAAPSAFSFSLSPQLPPPN